MAKPFISPRRNLRQIIGLASAALISVSSIGAGKTGKLKAGEIGVVSSVLDGDTLYLEDGLKVRLSAMQAPKLPLGRKGFKAWPMGEEAKAALTALTQKRRVQLFYGGKERDRYGRALAQVYTLNANAKRERANAVYGGMTTMLCAPLNLTCSPKTWTAFNLWKAL